MAILTALSEKDLAAFVGAYDLGALRRAEGIEAGTVNTSFLLELDAGRCFLRVYEEQGPVGAAREAALLAHLERSGVATPAPVRARDGAFVRLVAGGKPAALFPWVEGGMVCQKGVTAEHARLVGEALARVHQAGAPSGSPVDAGRFGPDELVKRCGRVASSREPEAAALAGELRARVEEVQAVRARRALPAGLVHGDLFRDNVLWAPAAGRATIAALLDFESAHHGPFAYDIAVTILSWAFGSDLDLDIARAIAAGYGSVRPLTAVEREGLYDEAILASLRFTITRITDNAIRVGKRWQRFVERRTALEKLGRAKLAEIVSP